ncbi:MAG: hypothetical protein R2703_15380 [Micropruina glycogenica]
MARAVCGVWLAPGGALPVVFAHTVVWFTAGSTTYEFEALDDSSYEPVEALAASTAPSPSDECNSLPTRSC